MEPEQKVRAIAPPVALGLAWLAFHGASGASPFRLVSSMWLHELGHAATAWLCGYAALPGPWRTAIPESRSPFMTLVVLAVLGLVAWWGWRARRWGVVAAAAALAVLQLVLTLGTKVERAQALILFFGDGGAMVLGTALVATFWVREGSYLHRTWLRWGFLFIGAFGFMDPFLVWWRARRDPDVIPFGELAGVGDTDPSRLADEHGWSIHLMITRYVTLGCVCLAVMAALYVVGLFRRPKPE
jgi:hypothetical protein